MSKVPPPRRNGRAIVVGFSVRALAEATAPYLGAPIAIDRFADQDCCDSSHHTITLPHWGVATNPEWRLLQQLVAAGAAADSPVLLGGGTENWPQLVEWLHVHFRVAGPTVEQLRQLRNAELWQSATEQTAICFPQTSWLDPTHRRDPSGSPQARRSSIIGSDHDWLIKPRNGAGGHAVRRVGIEHANDVVSPDHYWQRYVPGRVLGACCLLDGEGCVELLGVTESLSDEQWPGPSEFIYRGSLGPIVVPEVQRAQLVSLCRAIGASTQYRGWLQLDLVLDKAGQLWLLELNPRWSAGMEILFLAGANPVPRHYQIFQKVRSPKSATTKNRQMEDGKTIRQSGAGACSPMANEMTFGKGIVYADRELQLTRPCIERWQGLPRSAFADLPSHSLIPPGEKSHRVHCGEPLLTVRACGSHESLLPQLLELRQKALEIACT